MFKDRKPDPPKQHVEEKRDDESVKQETADESTKEEAIKAMSEVDQDEVETGKKMWLCAKITTLEKENGELRKALQEMEAKIELQGKMIAEMASTKRRD